MVSWTTLGNGDKRAFLTTADSSPLAVPSDWNSSANKIECLGAGAGDAGGGCAYASKSNVTLTASGTASFQVGVADTSDTWFKTSATVFAQSAVGGTGGQASSSIGDICYSGGDGPGFFGSGGGGAAGPHGPGNSASGDDGGSGDAGFGGAGGVAAAGGNGTEWDSTHGSGGGGGGSFSTAGAGGGNYGGGGSADAATGSFPGPGANGLIVITYTPTGGPPPPPPPSPPPPVLARPKGKFGHNNWRRRWGR
jgi:hypothetical protein